MQAPEHKGEDAAVTEVLPLSRRVEPHTDAELLAVCMNRHLACPRRSRSPQSRTPRDRSARETRGRRRPCRTNRLADLTRPKRCRVARALSTWSPPRALEACQNSRLQVWVAVRIPSRARGQSRQFPLLLPLCLLRVTLLVDARASTGIGGTRLNLRAFTNPVPPANQQFARVTPVLAPHTRRGRLASIQRGREPRSQPLGREPG
jgi:hypothetical protein